MNAFVKKKQGSDNALENYFLELVVQKKVIDREVYEILSVIEHSNLHDDYQAPIKKMLFGDENLYFENWWTLQDGLLDAIQTSEVRASETQKNGIVLEMILRLVETVFDVPDEDMYAFILLEQRESVEHDLIVLMKRMLEHLRIGLQELIVHAPNLSRKKDTDNHAEFLILQKNLYKLPHIFFETEKDKIARLENTVQDVYQKFIVQNGTHGTSTINFSE